MDKLTETRREAVDALSKLRHKFTGNLGNFGFSVSDLLSRDCLPPVYVSDLSSRLWLPAVCVLYMLSRV